jgi:hypothetical protein
MACTFWTETDEKPLLFRASEPARRLFLARSYDSHPFLSSRGHKGGDDADDSFRSESLGSAPVVSTFDVRCGRLCPPKIVRALQRISFNCLENMMGCVSTLTQWQPWPLLQNHHYCCWKGRIRHS